MRLFDELVAAGTIARCEHIVADNVWTYVEGRYGGMGYPIDDIPEFAPPFERFAVSFRDRSMDRVDDRVVLFTATRLVFGWDLLADVYIGERPLGFGPIGKFQYSVGPSGRLPAKYRFQIPKEARLRPGLSPDECGPPIATLIAVAVWALAFMSCKNVSQEVVLPPKALARKLERKRGVHPLPYRVLNVFPMREARARETHTTSGAPVVGAHIVRGHFATYSPDRPLFGKLTGTFWVPSHVRGDAALGTITKTYAVHPPAEASP